MTILDSKFTGKWTISPGKTPENQTLDELDPELNIIVEEE